jgi:uncharacterized oligopeptide transporter (OPT) family protein
MALGAIIAAIAKKAFVRTGHDAAKVETNLALLSSGFLGGEGITGVIIAIISMF